MSRIERARELQDRTKKFALRIISAFSRLPKTEVEAIWGEPLRRAVAAGAFTPRLQEPYEKLKTIDSKRPGE